MKYIKYFLIILITVYCISSVLEIAAQKESFQWDFELYYTAAKDMLSGNNPYAQGLYVVRGNYFPCCYPPLALYFFGIFTNFDYKTAYGIFFLFQVAILISIVLLWKNKILDKKPGLLFYVLSIMAFNGAIYLTFRSGNICFFEQFLIWIGFYYFINKKYNYFILAITMAAQFKLVPIIFLFLMLVSENKGKFKRLLLSFVPFGAIMLAQYLIMPVYFNGFIKNILMLKGEAGGIMSPSTFSLIQEIFRPENNPLPVLNIEKLHIIVYSAVVLLILFASYHAFKRLNKLELAGKERWQIFLSVIIYVLISMRFKDYSYLILIVPAYFILDKISDLKGYLFLAILLVLSAKYETLPYLANIFNLLWSYYPLFLAYLLYLIYVITIFSMTERTSQDNRQHIQE